MARGSTGRAPCGPLRLALRPDVYPGRHLQQALRVQGIRRMLVPGGTGVGWRAVWGLLAPTPPAGRCAPVLFDWSFTAGLCAAVSPAGPVLPQRQPAVLLGRLAGVLLSRASPGSRLRLPVAAAFFFLLTKRNVIPAGPRQGQASLRSVRTRTLDMALSARIEEAQEGGRKPQMPQQPAASRPGAVPHVLLPGARAGTGAQG